MGHRFSDLVSTLPRLRDQFISRILYLIGLRKFVTKMEES